MKFRPVGMRRLLLGGAGSALLLAGLGLAAITERALLLRDLAAARHGGPLVDADGRGPQAGLHGSLLRVVGTPQVVEAAHDPDFDLTVATPVLTRHVAMFQWRELRMGGQVSYEMDWSEQLQDSRHFVHPAGHANPQRWPLAGQRFDAGRVRLGGFTLGTALLHALPGSQPFVPDASRLPANLAASFSPYQGQLVTSADPARPRLGDLRVSWEAVPLQTVTVFARLDGDRLVPPPAGDGSATGLDDDVQLGERSFSDLLPDVPQAPAFVLARRVGAVALAALGAFLLLWERRRRKRDALLGLAVGFTAVTAVAAAVWLGGDTGPMLGWLGLAALGALAIGLLYRYLPAAVPEA